MILSVCRSSYEKKHYFSYKLSNPNFKKMKKTLSLIFALVSISIYAQRWPEARYFNGVKAGVNFFNINSDDIEFNSGTGFNGAYTRRIPLVEMLEANLFVEYQQNNFSVGAGDLLSSNSEDTYREVDYKMHSFRLGALANFKAYGPYFSVVAGPVIQFNDKLKFDEADGDLQVTTPDKEMTNTTVEDLSQVSGFNFLFAAGITAGDINYKVYGLYEFGMNNILSSVQTSGGNTLKGNTGVLTVGAIVYF